MASINTVLIAVACVTSLSGCAAGKMFMAGYKPPQTIADLLKEQGKLPNVGGLIQGEESVGNRGKTAITLDSYKGELSDQSLNPYSNAMTAPPEADYTTPWINANQAFRPAFSYKSLQDYAAQLSMELLKNSNDLSPDELIGVASFVVLDSSLKNSTVLGNQLSEYFIGEIQQLGMSVVDFKVRNTVVVNTEGDFVFSRNAKKLADRLNMDHVLSGTLIEKPSGTQINARIVSLSSNRVHSTASLMIPSFVSESLHRGVAGYSSE